MEYIFGKNTVKFFAESDQVLEIFIQENFSDENLLKFLQERKLKITIKDKNFFRQKINNVNHQGIMATIKEYKYYSLNEVLESIKDKKKPLIVVLDGIEDPQNLGAIIRTCEAFLVDAVIIPKHNSCKINATVAKVSTGALSNVKIVEVTNLTQTLKELKKQNYWIYMAEATNSTNYENFDYNDKTVLVVGSEGAGISRLVKQQADYNIKINMLGKVNSLNVSVAAGIIISYISLKHNL